MRACLFQISLWLTLLCSQTISLCAQVTATTEKSQLGQLATNATAQFGAPISHHYTPRDYKLDATLLSLSLVGNELLVAAENGLMVHSAGFFEIQENTRHLPITSQDSCDGKHIYAGTTTSIGVLEKDPYGEWQFSEIAVPELAVDSQVWSTICYKGLAYFVTNHTIFVVKDKNLLQTVKTTLWLTGGAKLHDRVVFTVQNSGLRSIAADGNLVTPIEFATLENEHVNTIGLRQTDAIIITENRIFRFDGKVVEETKRATLAPLLASRPYVTRKTAMDGLAIGTLTGDVWWLDAELNVAMRVSLNGSGVLDLVVDQESSTWAATERGLFRINWPAMWTQYSQSQGLLGNPKAVIQHQEKLWVAASNGLFFIEGNQLRPTGEPDEQATGFALAGGELLANYGSGVYSVTRQRMVDTLNRRIAEVLFADPASAQHLFVIGGEGVSRFAKQNGEWLELWHESGANACFGLIAMPTKNGQRQFLVKREVPLLMTLDQHGNQPKLEVIKGLPKSRAIDFFEMNGQVYASTEHTRLILRDKQFVTDTTLNVPMDARIFRGYVTKKGHQWLAGEHFIYYKMPELDQFLPIDLPGNGIRLTCMEPDGASMLFCDQLSLLRLRPFNATVARDDYQTQLAGISIQQKPLPVANQFSVSGNELIALRYSVDTQAANVKFRVRSFVQGEDPSEWSDPRAQNRWNISSLPAGTNYFEVAASINDGTWTKPHRLSLNVVGKWWQSGMGKYLALASLLLLLSTLIVFVIALRNRALRKRAAQLGHLIDERTRSLSEKTGALEKANRTLSELALKDGLTLVSNRRQFDSYLQATLKRNGSLGESLGHKTALCLMDLDHFKQYNDHFGHLAGDDLLRRAAQSMEEIQRQRWPNGLLARYGGEEFALVLANADIAQARELAEHMRWRIQQDFNQLSVTVSIGVALIDPATMPTSDAAASAFRLIERADSALYRAKKNGRNCVVCDELS